MGWPEGMGLLVRWERQQTWSAETPRTLLPGVKRMVGLARGTAEEAGIGISAARVPQPLPHGSQNLLTSGDARTPQAWQLSGAYHSGF